MAIFIIVPLILIVVFACTTTITVDPVDGHRLSEEEIENIKEEYYEEYGEDAELPDDLFAEKTIFSVENLLGVSTYMPTLINSIWLALIRLGVPPPM